MLTYLLKIRIFFLFYVISSSGMNGVYIDILSGKLQ